MNAKDTDHRDFTIECYATLLSTYLEHGYHLCAYEDYLDAPDRTSRLVILRHDVDRKPENSLTTARIEHALGVRGTYYFRIVPESLYPDIVAEIAGLGHEIGYHYEDLTLCGGDMRAAIDHFERGLARIRTWYPVRTICMHGSPLSRWDNRLIWTRYDYRSYGVVGEPYFDLNTRDFFYITDTGRRWDGSAVSVRDRMETPYRRRFRSTADVLEAVRTRVMPPRIMQNVHPQRWNDQIGPWLAEYAAQNVKNVLKRVLIRSTQMRPAQWIISATGIEVTL